MPRDWIWIEKGLALAIHDRQLAEHGGAVGVRDAGLLESALARPIQLENYADSPPDACNLAASLACAIARNHPFVDGNKRTAFVCYRVFLELNGLRLKATLEEKYLTMLAVAEGTMTEAEFAVWLRQHCQSS
jgi:death-on-curing protein